MLNDSLELSILSHFSAYRARFCSLERRGFLDSIKYTLCGDMTNTEYTMV